ncbi:MAG: twin-arginine translocase subunit TatC [Planctomycetota bacterium]|jgi:sec-independent protein translocase protein TatC|nr:twin-arginine translocase subunit TatC [Planctomycetota bacterium]
MSDENAPLRFASPSAPPAADGADGDFARGGEPPAARAASDEYPAESLSPAPGPPASDRGGEEGESADNALGDAVKNIGPHLEELRRRLVFSIAAFIPAFALGLWLYRFLWDALLLPLRDASPHLMRFQALTPSDGLILMMRLAFAFALVVSMPFWAAQIWGFMAPGLNATEKRWLHLACGAGGVLFAAGVLAAYFGGIPLALGYLLPLNQTLTGWENSFTGSGYVDFIVTCCFGFGLAFELPLVMFALGWAGLITPGGVKSRWRAVVIAVFVLAAVMTPPDPFSQLLLALPMLGLFYIGYLLVKWTERSSEGS